jgi:hypothetical protein
MALDLAHARGDAVAERQWQWATSSMRMFVPSPTLSSLPGEDAIRWPKRVDLSGTCLRMIKTG